MKTKIIISKCWKIIDEFDFLITLSKNDCVVFGGIEYCVDCCILNTDTNEMNILLRD